MNEKPLEQRPKTRRGFGENKEIFTNRQLDGQETSRSNEESQRREKEVAGGKSRGVSAYFKREGIEKGKESKLEGWRQPSTSREQSNKQQGMVRNQPNIEEKIGRAHV